MLKSFQNAAQIRDAFFAAGSSQPSFMVNVVPPPITDPNVTAKVDFYGSTITAQAGNSTPMSAAWPGPGIYQLKITLTTGAAAPPTSPAAQPAADAGGTPAATPTAPTPPDISILVNKTGVWSLFRLLDEAARGGGSVAFFSGGQTYKFQFASASAATPLNLNMVRQFQCPTKI